ncbi:MAG: CoA transferase [Deltaproteobacteria bacterium]|nr:CoA transferase [Deltaproteobacteria bacterium]
MNQPPLQKVKVLDMTRLVPGLVACSIMGDLGADVVKIEKPGAGDDLRRIPPHAQDGQGIYFKALARNMRSLALDTKTEKGKQVLVELIKQSDVFIHSFRPNVLEGQGLGQEDMLAVNQSLLYCTLNGFGNKGSLKERAAHDINYQALAGTLWPGLWPEKTPNPPGALAADYGGGLYCVITVLAGLLARDRQGKGQAIEVNLHGAILSMTGMPAAAALVLGRNFEPEEYRLSGNDPGYDVYKTKDEKYVALAALEPKFWLAFLDQVGLSRLANMRADSAKWPLLRAELKDLFASKTRAQWGEISKKGDFCLTEVLSSKEALSHPHAIQTGLVEKDPDGTTRLAFPCVLSGTPALRPGRAPNLGEHSKEVLMEIGMDPEYIDRLKSEGIIG